MGRKRSKLTGQKFGKLTVVKFSHINKRGNSCWVCKCNCGNEKIINSASLKKGGTTSCGCLWKAQKLPKGIAARNRVILKHKDSTKRRGIEQALTDEQIIAIHKRDCHYCGISPSNTYSLLKLNGSYTYNGIDRVDNNKGYTIDNVVPCCTFCNRAKHTKTYDEFISWLKRIQLYLTVNEIIL